MIPIENYGIKCMSMGSLVPEGDAVVWRGPMASFNCLSNFFIGWICVRNKLEIVSNKFCPINSTFLFLNL